MGVLAFVLLGLFHGQQEYEYLYAIKPGVDIVAWWKVPFLSAIVVVFAVDHGYGTQKVHGLPWFMGECSIATCVCL